MRHAAAITLWLCTAAAHAAVPETSKPAVVVTKPVDEISQAAIQSAFQVLRSEYIRRDDLTFDELNRAALQGLLSRLAFGAELIRDDRKEKSPPPALHGEMLTDAIAYLRPGACTDADADAMSKKLREFRDKNARSLILDLRAPSAPGTFEVAAAMLELFLPRDEVLFKLKQIGRDEAELFIGKSDPVWTTPLVVLIDAETGNIGETIAAVLHERGQALLVGAATQGRTVRYETVPVDDGWALRFARAEMLLRDGTSIFTKGLQPRFHVDLDARTKAAIFKNSAAASIKPHVFDAARARYNEAALVAGKNPELDNFIRRSNGKDIPADNAPARDLVLQRATDMLGGSAFIDETRIDWKKAKPPAAGKEAAGLKIPRALPVSDQ